MTDYICSHLNTHVHYGVVLLVAIFEYWLGKTSTTKSGSLIELIFNIFVSIKKQFKKGE